MKTIKKGAIVAGATVGGVIGGTISLIGKMTGKKFLDEIGESIIDSTILTGEIAGKAASGTTKIISGTVHKKPQKIHSGKNELKGVGKAVAGNVEQNVRRVVAQGGEIAGGVRTRDKRRVEKGVKKLVKMVVVGAVTVGAIKIKEEEIEESAKKENGEN